MHVIEAVEKTVINASGATVVFAGPCNYHGYKILGAAGAYTMDVYDSAAAASGQKVDGAVSVAAAASAIMDVGIRMDNGIVANMSGDPTDGQILVLWSR